MSAARGDVYAGSAGWRYVMYAQDGGALPFEQWYFDIGDPNVTLPTEQENSS